MSLERFCKKPVVTAAPADTVEDLARKMLAEHVGAVVVEADDAPIGIVTDRDLVCRAIAGGMNGRWATADAIMSSPPICVKVSEPIDVAIVRMRQHGVRRLPIITDEGMLCGIVSMDDLLVLLTAELREVGQVPLNDRGP